MILARGVRRGQDSEGYGISPTGVVFDGGLKRNHHYAPSCVLMALSAAGSCAQATRASLTEITLHACPKTRPSLQRYYIVYQCIAEVLIVILL